MREIKFRGKSALSIEEMESKGIEHENRWIYGSLIENGKYPVIVSGFLEVNDDYLVHEMFCSVEKESIGQYTGLKDKNGTDIYEGDIVRHATDEGVYKVVFEDGGFYVKNLFEYDFQTIDEYPLEVIGNTYKNPELLEESK